MGVVSLFQKLYLILLLSFFFYLDHHLFVHSSSSLSSSITSNNHLCPHEQRLALIHFNQTLSFDYSNFIYECGSLSYRKTSHWNTNSDCCSWDGVTCDASNGDVIGLDLSCSQLVGRLPSNSTLFQLHHLQSLNLAYNDFHGSRIPKEIHRFANTLTHLNLSHSAFSGQIPLEISRLSKLVSLDLSSYPYINYILHLHNNKSLRQFLLQHLFQNLTHLSLSNVYIGSALPSNLSYSSSPLIFLDLSGTGLRGKISDKIFTLPNLQTLNLAYNYNVTGISSDTNLSTSNHHTTTQLTYLDLKVNNLEGPIPNVFVNLTHLTYLGLSFNKLEGPIPNAFANLTHLTYLDLSYNNLEGPIPNAFVNLVHLTSLNLRYNNFDIGPFPSWVGNNSQLVELDMSGCSLKGALPTNISGLQKLTSLWLSSNSLNGTIPYWVFSLPLLQELDLGSNSFKGQLDEFRFVSHSLQSITLRGNELHGFFPHSLFKHANLTRLDLENNNLSGIIEIEMFSTLKKLTWLFLSNNNLTVRPSSTNITFVNATFPNLGYLRLSSLKIEEFPSFISAMSQLVELDLSNSGMCGVIPHWVGWDYSLDIVNISHNYLTGSLGQVNSWPYNVFMGYNSFDGPFPPQICNSSRLEFLDLSYNNLSGMLPRCLGNFSNVISVIDLQMNHFDGAIPFTFSKGNSLSSLNLNGNNFKGLVPRSLVDCDSLQVLDIGDNKINDTFPWWLQSLPQLHVLVLRSNRFHGPISINSNTKILFPNLRVLDLSNNEFSGPLPAIYFKNFQAMMNIVGNSSEPEYVEKFVPDNDATLKYLDSVVILIKGVKYNLTKILTVFTIIDLSSNKFEGHIPNSIGDLTSLRHLNLSNNSLTGRIPFQLGNLSVLESLDLSWNQLDGEIPQELANGLGFLAVLNVSKNHLSGRVPKGKQFDAFDKSSYVDNLGLCGEPVLSSCKSGKASQKPVSQVFQGGEDDSEFASGFTWQSVLMGYGSGVILGFLIGYFMLLVGSPKWFVEIVERECLKLMRKPKKRGIRRSRRRNQETRR